MLIPRKVGTWALKEDELRRTPLPRTPVNSGHQHVRQASSAGIMLMRTQESKERPRVRPRRRTVPARRDLRPSPKQRGRMDPYHDRVLERERVAVEDCVAYHGRSFAPAWEGLRGGSGRRGRAAGGAEHDVGGEHVTLAI